MISSKKLQAMKILQEEYKNLTRSPMVVFGITVGLFDENDIFNWKCTISGPKDTCYKGGLFTLRIQFPDNYPDCKPEIAFMTPIYHLNVKFTAGGGQPIGHVCFSSINSWKSDYRINKLLPEIFYLFKANNPDSPYDYMDNRRRNEYVNNRDLFYKKAEYFTKKYANPLGNRKEYPNGWDFTYNGQ